MRRRRTRRKNRAVGKNRDSAGCPRGASRQSAQRTATSWRQGLLPNQSLHVADWLMSRFLHTQEARHKLSQVSSTLVGLGIRAKISASRGSAARFNSGRTVLDSSFGRDSCLRGRSGFSHQWRTPVCWNLDRPVAPLRSPAFRSRVLAPMPGLLRASHYPVDAECS